MELEPRTSAPAHATGAVEFVPLAAVSDDATFRLREEGDVSALAASIGRLGHLVPVELRPLPGAAEGGPRYQVVAGFRRLAALRLLARERVIARIHASLDDDDAWGIALAQGLLGEPLGEAARAALRERLVETRIAPWAVELLDAVPLEDSGEEEGAPAAAPAPAAAAPEPAAPAPAPEPVPAPEPEEDLGPVEVTVEELAADLSHRLFEVNQDLALAFSAWGELPEEGRRMIVEQLRYVAEIYARVGGRR